MELKIGREKVNVTWSNFIVYAIASIILFFVVNLIGISIYSINLGFFDLKYLQHYINFSTQLLSFLGYGVTFILAFFFLEVSKKLGHKINEDYAISMSITILLFNLVLYLILEFLVVITNKLPLDAFSSVSYIISLLFSAVFFYMSLCFLQTKKSISTDVILASLSIFIFPLAIMSLVGINIIPTLDSPLVIVIDIARWLSRLVFIFITLNYVLSQKGKLSIYLYGVGVLLLIPILLKLSDAFFLEEKLFSLVTPFYLVASYSVARILVKK